MKLLWATTTGYCWSCLRRASDGPFPVSDDGSLFTVLTLDGLENILGKCFRKNIKSVAYISNEVSFQLE
jgi:hypothetical protein